MIMKGILIAALMWAAFVLLAVSFSIARAQPSFQNNVVPYCPIPGIVDAQSNPVVIPCGFIYQPLSVQITQMPSTAMPTTQCPANPISRKVPPIC